MSATVINFFVPKDRNTLTFTYNGQEVTQIEAHTTVVNKIKYVNIYWTWYYHNCPLFKEYVEHLAKVNTIEEKEREEYNIQLYRYWEKAIDETFQFTTTMFDIPRDWVNRSKKTSTSIFLDEKQSLDVAHFICGLIVSFPLVTEPGKTNVWNFNDVTQKLTDKFRIPIYNLLRISSSRIKFDNFKEFNFFVSSVLSPNTAFLINFCFSLFNLVACSPVFLPPEYTTGSDKRVTNFYGYFVSVISDNQKYILMSFVSPDTLDSNLASSMINKEMSYDILQSIYSNLLTSKMLDMLGDKLIHIRSCVPTPLTDFASTIVRQTLGVSQTLVEKYSLEYQYLLYLIVSSNKKLRSVIRSGLDLLRVGAKGGTPLVSKKSGSDLPIITALMSKDVPFIDFLVNKVRKLIKVKNYKLVYLDDPQTQFTNQAVNKMLSDFALFYIKSVVEDDPMIALEIHRSLHKIGLFLTSKDDFVKLLKRIV